MDAGLGGERMERHQVGPPGLDIRDRVWVVEGRETQLGDVGAVRLEAIQPSVTRPVVATTAGLLGVLGGLWMTWSALWAPPTSSPLELLPGLELVVGGLLVVSAGTVRWRRDRARWKVVACTALGDRVVLTTSDHTLAERTIARLHEARAEATEPPRRQGAAWPA